MSNKTPALAAQTATQTGVLKNRNRLTLIGIMGTPKAPRALLLTTTKRALTVSLGDSTPGGRVVAIGTDNIVLQSGQRTTELKMPD